MHIKCTNNTDINIVPSCHGETRSITSYACEQNQTMARKGHDTIHKIHNDCMHALPLLQMVGQISRFHAKKTQVEMANPIIILGIVVSNYMSILPQAIRSCSQLSIHTQEVTLEPRIKGTLGPAMLSFVGRLSSSRRFKIY